MEALKLHGHEHEHHKEYPFVTLLQDMDDYTESRRRLRASEADLEAMRALYLDETQTHARTADEKGEVNRQLKRKEAELEKKEETILEKEREIEALKDELMQAGGGREDLEKQLQVCVHFPSAHYFLAASAAYTSHSGLMISRAPSSNYGVSVQQMYQEKIEKMSELEKKANVAAQRLSNARAEAEHVSAYHIQIIFHCRAMSPLTLHRRVVCSSNSALRASL